MLLYAITAIISVIITAVARIIVNHKLFREQEYIYSYERKATNEEVEENKVYAFVESQNRKTRIHGAPQKEVAVKVFKYHRNC